MATLLSAAMTHVGFLRANNEDAYLSMPETGVFAVCDGMGGEAAGEIASRHFIETAQAAFTNETAVSSREKYELVETVFRCSNKSILEYAARHPNDRGMGCTADILTFYDSNYVIGHVGDSRVYLVREGRLQQLTKDHSLVQLQVDNGLLTPEEAKKNPKKNIILRAVGTDPSISIDILKGASLNRDIFLLCSDGLTDMVEDSAIQNILASTESLQKKAEGLVGAALEAAGRDNVTVVLCQVGLDDPITNK